MGYSFLLRCTCILKAAKWNSKKNLSFNINSFKHYKPYESKYILHDVYDNQQKEHCTEDGEGMYSTNISTPYTNSRQHAKESSENTCKSHSVVGKLEM